MGRRKWPRHVINNSDSDPLTSIRASRFRVISNKNNAVNSSRAHRPNPLFSGIRTPSEESMYGYMPKAIQDVRASSALEGRRIDDYFSECRRDTFMSRFARIERNKQKERENHHQFDPPPIYEEEETFVERHHNKATKLQSLFRNEDELDYGANALQDLKLKVEMKLSESSPPTSPTFPSSSLNDAFWDTIEDDVLY